MKAPVLNILMSFFCIGIGLKISASELDAIAIETGTDKSSKGHFYTKVYERYFHTIKDKPLKILEIGFCRGFSAKMWDKYFANSQIYSIDIDRECCKCTHGLSDRSHLYMVNQENVDDLNSFINEVGGEFDIIIDDGGHTMNQQITSFNVLFPHLKSGGLYFVEDLFTSYLTDWYGPVGGYGTRERPQAGPGTTIRFLQNLVDDVNYFGARAIYANWDTCSEEIKDNLTYFQKHIESMHFYTNLCVIIKR